MEDNNWIDLKKVQDSAQIKTYGTFVIIGLSLIVLYVVVKAYNKVSALTKVFTRQ